MKKNIIYVAGPEIPCARCKRTFAIVEKVVQSLDISNITEVQHINLSSKSTIEKYGSLRSPAVIVNDIVISEGELPREEHIVKSIKQILKIV